MDALLLSISHDPLVLTQFLEPKPTNVEGLSVLLKSSTKASNAPWENVYASFPLLPDNPEVSILVPALLLIVAFIAE